MTGERRTIASAITVLEQVWRALEDRDDPELISAFILEYLDEAGVLDLRRGADE